MKVLYPDHGPSFSFKKNKTALSLFRKAVRCSGYEHRGGDRLRVPIWMPALTSCVM